ncbi:MAG: F0F1 ATP synthase subunit epsilon [Bradyrhizobium sp.]
MRLRITTPLSVVVDEDGILALRAEDATGSFGILPRHADSLTSLAVSIVSWRSGNETQHYCAVRGGVSPLILGGISPLPRARAVTGDDLAALDQTILGRFRVDIETERTGACREHPPSAQRHSSDRQSSRIGHAGRRR